MIESRIVLEVETYLVWLAQPASVTTTFAHLHRFNTEVRGSTDWGIPLDDRPIPDNPNPPSHDENLFIVV